ncbi:mitochondrial import inner membrane translocase subunit Tim9-like [Syzygium oleosum]|uniref:mitochondrial import inner membrane translocase subunit Tim9-like n=1 Tax=Syzygium oleosum TaxID=219896 RepID=UPI0011D1E058|nr:mitochondrial import inner membrane translocase subunit Tim9-like [Syzygium oleosum]
MDKTILGELDSLPEEDKLRLSAFVDRLQARDSLRLYNSLVERCFIDCIDSFYRKSLGKQEERCVLHCAEKFLKVSAYVGIRLAELNQAEQQSNPR